jgi:hypothetical protein
MEGGLSINESPKKEVVSVSELGREISFDTLKKGGNSR